MTRWVRVGECNRCGDCCREETLLARIKAYEAARIPYRIVNKGCENFIPETGLCKDYENRPPPCREFPTHPIDIVALPRCGFHFINLGQKEMIKVVRDSIVPILVNQARLEMMNMYKPGVVEPLGATVGINMSTMPLKTIKGPFIKRDFYALYKVLVSLKPLIPVSLGARELLQDHVQTRIHSTSGNVDKALEKDGTLVIYSVDFWITREGEVWNEQTDGLWRKVLQLPEGLLQACYLNLSSTLNVKYVV